MFITLLAGALLKIYDDLVVDNLIITEPYAVTALRSLVIVTTTLCFSSKFLDMCLVFESGACRGYC